MPQTTDACRQIDGKVIEKCAPARFEHATFWFVVRRSGVPCVYVCPRVNELRANWDHFVYVGHRVSILVATRVATNVACEAAQHSSAKNADIPTVA